MPQVTNPDGTRIGDALNPLGIQTTNLTGLTGTYVFSVSGIAGTVAALNALSLFVPLASPFSAVVGPISVSCTAASGSSVTDPMKAYRITTATAGTLQAASAIGKFQTAYPNPGLEVRTANPTVTLGAQLFSSPPAVSPGLITTAVHQINPLIAGFGPFTLAPGEGIALRQDVGDVDLRWNISMVWAEKV